MTNLGKLLILLPSDNYYVQDIADTECKADKIFSVSRKSRNFPFKLDFNELEKNGFMATKLEQFDNKLEIILEVK